MISKPFYRILILALLVPMLSFAQTQTNANEGTSQEPVKLSKFYISATALAVSFLEKDFGWNYELGAGYRLNNNASLELQYTTTFIQGKSVGFDYYIQRINANFDYFPLKYKRFEIGSVAGLACLFYDKKLGLEHDAAVGVDLGFKIQDRAKKGINTGFYLINTYAASEMGGMITLGVFFKFIP